MDIICVLASDLNIKKTSIRNIMQLKRTSAAGSGDNCPGIEDVHALWALINMLISRAKIPGVSRCLEL